MGLRLARDKLNSLEQGLEPWVDCSGRCKSVQCPGVVEPLLTVPIKGDIVKSTLLRNSHPRAKHASGRGAHPETELQGWDIAWTGGTEPPGRHVCRSIKCVPKKRGWATDTKVMASMGA